MLIVSSTFLHLKILLVHVQFCFSSGHTLLLQVHYPESRSLPFQSRATIHESGMLQEKEESLGGSSLYLWLSPVSPQPPSLFLHPSGGDDLIWKDRPRLM